MLKKMALSTLLLVSTITPMQLSLDLDLTLQNGDNPIQVTPTLVIDNETVTPVMFEGIENLIVNFFTQMENDNTVVVKAAFLQQTEENEFVAITNEPIIAVRTTWGETATITISDASADEESNDALVLKITPSRVE